MLAEYFPVLMFLGVATGLSIVLLLVGAILGPNKSGDDKLAPYECGFEAFEDARMKFDVRYYLVAILFIIFDLEIAFFFPWATVLGGEEGIGWVGFITMMVFLAVLVVGFIYEWCKGALGWE